MPVWFRPLAFERGHQFGTFLGRHPGQQGLDIHRATRLPVRIGVDVRIQSGLARDATIGTPFGLCGDDDRLGRHLARVFQADVRPIDGNGRFDLVLAAGIDLRADGVVRGVHVVLRCLLLVALLPQLP